MSQTHAFPRPSLGDVYVRRNLNGSEEESMVLSVQYKAGAASSLWQATLMTKNGIEFVGSDREHRNIYDWRPQHYVFDDINGNWYSPSEKAKLEEARAAEAAKEAAKAEAPAHKDDFLVADAAEIPNAFAKKRALKVAPVTLPTPQV